MYGIIPTASPSDPSYGRSSREVVPRTDSGSTPFADRLEQSSSNRFHQQRNEAEDAAKRASDSAQDARARVHDAANKSQSQDRQLSRSDADHESQKAAAGDSDHPDKKAADGHDDAATAAAAAAAQDATHDQKPRDQVHAGKTGAPQQAGELDKPKVRVTSAANVKQAAAGAEQGKASAESGPTKAKDTGEKAASAAAGGSARTSPPTAKENALGHPAEGVERPTSDEARPSSNPTTGDESVEARDEAIAERAERSVDRENGSKRTPGEGNSAEALVDRKEQTDASDRDRRVRGGGDPRERRIAAEKAGTRTVDAKAVAPVEAENATTERMVTKELSVDLSDATQQRDAGHSGGDESVLSPGRMEASLGSNTARSPSVSQATQTLARRLNGELGDTIVRQAKVMLQDANTAELRLVIRPPELGRIRIRLQMENGHIAGRILVDNGSVREVVEQNLASLQRAFEEAGLEMGDLEVSTGDARDEAQTSSQEHGGSEPRTATAGAESFGRSIETISEYEPGRHRINLVA